MYHKLLERQIRKYFGDAPISDELTLLLKTVSDSYNHFDQDRKMLERSIEISSGEMIELNRSSRRALDNLKSLFDNIDEVFFSVAFPSFEILQISPACEKMFGYPPEHFKTRKNMWYDQVIEEDKHIINENYKLLFQDETFTKEYRFKNKNGEIKWAQSKITPCFDSTGILIRIDGVTEDITNRKSNEFKILESEKKFKSIIQSSHDLIQSVYLNGEFDFVNDSWLKTMGYSKKEVNNLNLFGVIAPDCMEYCQSEFMRVLNGETLEYIRTTFLKKSGEEIILVGNATPVFKDGVVVGAQSFFEDVTEKERAEEKATKFEKRFRILIENSEDALSLMNEEGKLIYQSPSIDRMLGFSFDERKNASGLDYIHPEDKPEAVKIFQSSINNPFLSIPFQHRTLCKNGNYIWVEGTIVNMLNDENVQAIVANFRDVTRRKNAEDEIKTINNNLKINNERLREAQKIAHIGSWMQNMATNRVVRSDEFFRIMEIEFSEVPFEFDEFKKFIHPEDRDKVELIYNEAIFQKKSFQYEARLQMKDGRIKYIFADGNLILGDDGEISKMYGIIQDISEYKNTQIELEQKVSELKKTNSELDKFVYSVSHDLRAPISSVMGLVEIVKFDSQEDNIHPVLDMMVQNLQKLDGFISDILDYSRNARTEINIESIDFDELLNDSIQSLRFIGGNYQKVKINTQVNCINSFSSDRKRISIILNNILSNAIRYQNTAIENPFVNISINQKEDMLSIEVSDNGIGIPEEYLDDIFKMFYRLSKKSAGSGLGLYIAQETVIQLKGTITVNSQVNKGTVFKIDLPNLN